MTTLLTVPYSGALLVSHMAAFGVSVLARDAGREVALQHDPMSQSFDISVRLHASLDEVAQRVLESVEALHPAIEDDLEAGKRGNARRPTIWARATFTNDPDRAVLALRRQTELLRDANERSPLNAALLSGIGMTGAWLQPKPGPGPAGGASALDGVLGNNTSDLVRGLLRRTRDAVAGLDVADVAQRLAGSGLGDEADRTTWAPPGTPIDWVWQWLAALGLSVFPVAHRARARSVTPAAWTRTKPSRRGVTLPLFSTPMSFERASWMLNLRELPEAAADESGRSAARLRALGIDEIVEFPAVYKAGAGSSVAFTFGAAEYVDVRTR